MRLFTLAFRWLLAFLLINIFLEKTASAQTVLDRLEQQIRQRVSPSQEGTPAYRSPTTPPPAIQSSSDKPSVTDQPVPIYLGVTADDRKDRGRGVRITDVRPGSPAEKAGLRNQDLVTALMGVRVRQLTDMTEILGLYKPDDVAEFDIIRDGAPQKIKVTLGRRLAAPASLSQTAEVIPLPPGELILPEPSSGKTAPSPAQTNSPSDSEIIEQLQNRIVELERQVADLERALSEARNNNK